MTDNTKSENELIAEFMNLIRHSIEDNDGYKEYEWYDEDIINGQYINGFEPPPYNTSWDWLMPVVEKIRKMERDPNEMFMGTTVDRHLHFIAITEKKIICPIDFLHSEIVEFIKWYNSQKS